MARPTVSSFDYSVENHFKATDTIEELCNSKEENPDEIFERFSSKIVFLTEWKDYSYNPRGVRITSEGEKGLRKNVEVNLPQFSSAKFPNSSTSSEDFFLHVGGAVWGLDWCPMVHRSSVGDLNCQYLAVAAHPPRSSPYHKLGVPLTGRGVIQIWCLSNLIREVQEPAPFNWLMKPRGKGRPRKKIEDKDEEIEDIESDGSEEKYSPPLKKARGRPRKKQKDDEDYQPGHVIKISGGRPKRGRRIKDQSDDEETDSIAPEFPNESSGVLAVYGEVPTNGNQFAAGKGKDSLPAKKGRGRLRKTNKSLDDFEKDTLDIELPNESSGVLTVHGEMGSSSGNECDVVKGKDSPPVKKGGGRSRKINKSLGDMIMVTNENQTPTCQSGQANVIEKDSPSVKTCRRRPRKKMDITEQSDDIKRDTEFFLPISTVFPKAALVTRATRNCDGHSLKCDVEASLHTETPKDTKEGSDSGLSLQNEDKEPYTTSKNKVESEASLVNTTSRSDLQEDIALPRVVLFLAHNGKVAWDVKWRPINVDDPEGKHRLGYLAALLGNGSLEVWEVPSLSSIKLLYSSCKKDGSDPRFVKLAPVFRCSMVKYRDRQCIPITMEWSSSAPHDFILAGCHDGTVAVWKFFASSYQDTRPLLCFSADTLPIRSIAWAPAPDEDDIESKNLIVTAGHGSLRFWDIRDPFRPVWELIMNPAAAIYSVDWLQDPKCVILSLDDGTLRILSLKAAVYANDFPVTEKRFAGSQQQGFQVYLCSAFPIWSVQVSNLTGQVAYCSSDGSVLQFQLLKAAVDSASGRHRTPHFLCGSLTEDDDMLTLNIPQPNIPFTLKKSINELGNSRKSMNDLCYSTPIKKAKEKTPDNRTLALCYGEEDSSDPEHEGSATSKKSKSKPKPKKKKSDPNVVLDTSQMGENQEESRTEPEVFPSKLVAMHRVRWNKNKGSERWLCSGGAAGIIRCQEMSMSSFRKP